MAEGRGLTEARLRAVIGLPAYNHAPRLREALESLLIQSYPGLRIIVSDDGSEDETPAIVAEYAAQDHRIVYRRTDRRMGYIGNARLCFALGREMFPEAEFFAWASDHDIWHPAWLESHIAAFDRHPRAVAACCRSFRMDADGSIAKSMDDDLDTTAIEPVRKRFIRTFNGMSAGNMVYGLYRAEALEKAGIMRWHILPDRLLLAELSLYGSMASVPEYLWFRRYRKIASIERQIAASFLGEPPRHVRYPWWLSHPVTVWKEYGLGRNPHSPISRSEGKKIALLYGVLGLGLVNWRWRMRIDRRYIRPIKRRVTAGARTVGRALISLPGKPHRIFRPLYLRFGSRKDGG